MVQPTGPPPSAGELASTGSDGAGIAASGGRRWVLAGALLLGGLGLTRRAQRGGRFWS